jgi:NADPH2:quinone reductase
MSSTMRAIVIREPGGPEVLEVQERPRPRPASTEVVIRVVAAGLNGADLLQRKGKYPVPPGVSAEIPGLEAAGVVAEVGDHVTRWKIGDEVTALLSGGGYAEFVAVAEGQCLPMPSGSDLLQAASLPETCCTVWSNVFELGGLQAGETILIHGGSSGIGTTAIQLAAARGATIIVTAGSPAKLKACHELGAHHVINYKNNDFEAQVKERTQGHGADVILDIVGGGYLQKNLEALAPGGRLVIIATKGGSKGELDISLMMRKQATITGSLLRPRLVEDKSRLVREVETHVWPLLRDDHFHPVIDSVFPMRQVAEAHRRLESSEHIGKIILSMAD